MSHEYILWIATFVYGLHIMEEHALDWRGWARGVMKMPAEWSEFYVVNAVVILYGSVASCIGWRCPSVALSFPALMLINTIFHFIPVLKTRRFSPGLFTAILLFIPIGGMVYYDAVLDHVLSMWTIIFSTIIGVLFMAYPLTLQKLKTKSFFRQQV
jgi:hypothetical protein